MRRRLDLCQDLAVDCLSQLSFLGDVSGLFLQFDLTKEKDFNISVLLKNDISDELYFLRIKLKFYLNTLFKLYCNHIKPEDENHSTAALLHHDLPFYFLIQLYPIIDVHFHIGLLFFFLLLYHLVTFLPILILNHVINDSHKHIIDAFPSLRRYEIRWHFQILTYFFDGIHRTRLSSYLCNCLLLRS